METTSLTPEEAGINSTALQTLDNAIQADIDAGKNYGASIIVARHGHIVHQKTFGTATPERPLAANDKFLLMSMTKAYVATLALKAIDEGRFTLDTKVGDLVPGFGTAGKERATVRQLMTHTAGLPFSLIPQGLPLDQVGNLAAKTEAINRTMAEYVPGTRAKYTSALGYDLLGQILVNTDPSGRGFSQIMQEDLFTPLGMAESTIGLSADDPRRVPASATEKNMGPATPILLKACNEFFTNGAEFPAGNAYSTIDDVFKFSELLRGKGSTQGQRLISPALFEYADQNHTGDLRNEGWVFETEKRGVDTFPANFSLLGGYVRGEGHYFTPVGFTASPSTMAAVGGGSTSLIVDPERDFTFIMLTAGFFDGMAHLERVSRMNDLALATVEI